MPHVPGLRSPYSKVGRIVFFGRMLDKIRLHAAGRLPAEYVANLGDRNPLLGDGRCCRFLRVRYEEVKARALVAGTADADVLRWCEAQGGRRTDEECEVWNGFMMKLGWRDRATARLRERIQQAGLAGRPIETMFDFFDFEEGRDPVATRAWEPQRPREPMMIVMMGVSGSGKTTIGQRLATELGWSFRDADEFHPAENVKKMSAGHPLTDADRAPWLAAIRAYIERTLARGVSAIVTCSALKERYREQLAVDPRQVKFVHLAGSFELIEERMRHRHGHFMRPEMLRSQMETLEPPRDALTVDVAPPPGEIVAEIRRRLNLS